MADDIARLGIEINSKKIKEAIDRLDKLEAQAGKTEKATDKMRSSFSGLGAAIGAIGVGIFTKKIIDATVAQQKAVAQLNAAIESTGMAAGLSSEELQKMASELQGVTTFGDEAVISMQSVLLTFTKIGEETFPRASEVILDVATRMGTDLQSAALQVGKALNDPIRGLDGLSRAGIQFTDEQKDVIKSLAETGQVAEAQALVLNELETQFGGAARAARQTLGGALEALGNAFGDLLEEDGDGLTDATAAIESLTQLMASPETKAAFGTITSAVVKLVELAAKGAANFASFGKALGEFVGEAAYGPLEKEATQALALVNKQKEVVDGLRESAQRYRANLELLRQDGTATAEQIAAHEEMTAAQEALLERETRRLAVMQGINQETKAGIELEQQKKEITASEAGDGGLGFDFDAALAQAEFEDEMLDRQRERAEERMAIEKEANRVIRANYIATATSIASVLGDLAGKNRAIETAALLVQKGAAAANVNVSAEEAKMKALALDPTGTVSGPMIAAIEANRIASLAAIAASTITSIGGGSGGGGGGGAGGTPGGGDGLEPPQGIQQPEDTQEKVIRFEDLDPDTFMTVKNIFKMLNEATDRGYRFEVG